MLELWKLTNPQGTVWNLLFQEIMDHIVEKGFNSLIDAQIHSQCPKRCKFRMRKQQWTENGRSSKRFQHGSWTKIRTKRRLFWRHKETKRKSTLLHGWTSVISKNVELEPKQKKYKGSVVLRGDSVKDDSGSYAVFTSRFLCVSNDGRTSDWCHCKATWLCRTSRCSICHTSRHMDTSSTKKMAPNHGQTLKIQWFLLERNLNGHPLAGLLQERQFEEVLLVHLGLGVKKYRIWRCLFVHRKTRMILIGTRGWYHNGWNEARIWLPCGRNWWRMLVLTNQLHFMITNFWDAVNVNASRTKSLLMNTGKCSNHEFLLKQLKIYHCGRNLAQKLSRGPMTWKVMWKSALKDIVSWQTK